MANDYQRLWEDVTDATNEAEAVRALAGIVVDKGGRRFISRLDSAGMESCIEILDHVSRDPTCTFSRLRRSRQGITEHNLTSAEKQYFLVTLRRLAGSRGRLPDRMIITDEIKVSDVVSASGAFGEVRSGVYMGQPVAVKTARIVAKDNLQKIRKVSIDGTFTSTGARFRPLRPQRFYREVILWKMLSHQNVLKLVGVQEDMGKGEFVTVSEWMEHGTIMEYIGKNYTNRLKLVRDSTPPTTSPNTMRQ